MTRAIHHFAPMVHRGDAVGRHTLRLREAARSQGFESTIYVDTMERDTQSETSSVLDYPAAARSDDILVYQFATASRMATWLVQRRETLVVNYHNVTPPEYFAPWDYDIAIGQARAQEQLGLLAPRSQLAIADSAYNETHLAEAGFVRSVVVAPSASLDRAPFDALAQARTSSEGRGSRLLCIGRLAPNKAVEDVIAALLVLRSHDEPDATLQIIGKPATTSYGQALHRYVAQLGLQSAVTFTGHASDVGVLRAYGEADVLVVASDHEGFCVPVTEAMAAGLPIVAFAAGALPEVVGGAGVLVGSRNPYDLAGAVHALVRDEARKADLRRAGVARLDVLDLATAADRIIAAVAGVGSPERSGGSRLA